MKLSDPGALWKLPHRTLKPEKWSVMLQKEPSLWLTDALCVLFVLCEKEVTLTSTERLQNSLLWSTLQRAVVTQSFLGRSLVTLSLPGFEQNVLELSCTINHNEQN